MDLYEVRLKEFGGRPRQAKKLSKNDNLFDIKRDWPLITEGGRSATHKYFHFEVRVKASAPEHIHNIRMG